MRLPLNNQNIVRPMMLKVRDMIEAERDRINQILNVYRKPGGGMQGLGPVFVGLRPNRNLKVFPNIIITSTTRSPQWDHSRVTKDTVTLRIFCNVFMMDDDTHEYMMHDLTDCVASILMQNPGFYFEGKDGDPPVPITYHTNTSSVLGISYGTIDSGYLKSGQIDWGCELYVNWPNLTYFTNEGMNSGATNLIFDNHPSSTATVNVPFATQPLVLVKNDVGVVANTYIDSVTLSIKADTGTDGASLIGTATVDPIQGVYIFEDVAINTAGTGFILEAASGDVIVAESTPIDVYPKPELTTIVDTIDDMANDDVLDDIVVYITDANGDIAYGYQDLVSLEAESMLGNTVYVSGVTSVYAIHGIATFSTLKIHTDTTPDVVRLYVVGNNVDTSVSNTFNVSA